MFSRVLVVSDNQRIITFLVNWLTQSTKLTEARIFRFVCSPNNKELDGQDIGTYKVNAIDIRKQQHSIIREYDLVISAHCKQLFPDELVRNCTCVNIHPGFNPYNRGWYPQVFSIINKKPLGATIHLIDPQIDHGDIIAQVEVPVLGWDTSLEVYNRVQAAEEELIKKHLPAILENQFEVTKPKIEGNINHKKDFDTLCKIPLEQKITYHQAIDRLRALSHGEFKNGYYVDPGSGRKIFLRLHLEPEDKTHE